MPSRAIGSTMRRAEKSWRSPPTVAFPLPPLPPLQARSFRVAAFDRAGNESKDGPRIAFTTPAILDIGPKKTGQPELVTLVNRASKPDGTSVAGWVTLGKTSEKVGSWTGENILNSEYRALENDAVLKVTLPNGHYRISLLITDGPSPTAKVLLDGVLVWHFPTRHWTTTVEPFLAQVTKGAMELTLPRAFGLLGVVIVPEQPGQAPQWTVANPMPVVESLEFQRISDEKAPHFDFNKASLRLRWPAATGARSYRVIVNNEPRYVINLTAVELEKLPIDTPLDIRIDAVDRDGRITSSKTSARKLTPGCSALASCFRGSL